MQGCHAMVLLLLQLERGSHRMLSRGTDLHGLPAK